MTLMLASVTGPAEAELALDENGKFLALKVMTLANMGGYLSTFGPNIPTNLYGPLLSGVYTTPAIYCNVKVVFTNTVLLATEVNLSEEIQVEKWSARKAPASAPRTSSRPESWNSSPRAFHSA